MSGLRIVVTGLIAQHPSLGGMTWHYLQYLVGLARLGHEVYYFEDSGQLPYNLHGGASGEDWLTLDCQENTEYLTRVLTRYGLGDRWAYRYGSEFRWFGLSDEQREQVLHTADLLINVSGTLEHPERYRSIPRLAYVDTDPVVTQIKYVKRSSVVPSRLDSHDVHFSFGEDMSEAIPKTGHDWLPTRQPIVLQEWKSDKPVRNVWTTVMNWTSYSPLEYGGRVYGQKDLEFQKFLELPELVSPARLEVALARHQHKEWQSQLHRAPARIRELMRANEGWSPRELLETMGWSVVDANDRCGDFDDYRNYIQSSRGEWSVAKNAYVEGSPGWFSERSACYLASGRPVVVEDTGFGSVLPVGEGLLSFKTLAEAAAAVRDVNLDYDRHCRAARKIAEEYFDSDQVLTDLVERALARAVSSA